MDRIIECPISNYSGIDGVVVNSLEFYAALRRMASIDGINLDEASWEDILILKCFKWLAGSIKAVLQRKVRDTTSSKDTFGVTKLTVIQVKVG